MDYIYSKLNNSLVSYNRIESITLGVCSEADTPIDGLAVGDLYLDVKMYDSDDHSYADFSAINADIDGIVTALETSIAEKQDALTAGDNITIENNVISAVASGDSDVKTLEVSLDDDFDWNEFIAGTTMNLVLPDGFLDDGVPDLYDYRFIKIPGLGYWEEDVILPMTQYSYGSGWDYCTYESDVYAYDSESGNWHAHLVALCNWHTNNGAVTANTTVQCIVYDAIAATLNENY